ncbi:hypothetical protein [Micromonospora sp. KC207]|nr:hypothetical protein [Micromonospora sp. KC207]
MPGPGGVPLRFYRWIASEPAQQARAAAKDALAEQITRIHADSGGT